MGAPAERTNRPGAVRTRRYLGPTWEVTPPRGPAHSGVVRTAACRLAYPLHCKRAGEDTWKLRLRCPDCERTWSRCAPTLEVRRFDRRLADDRRSLVEHLREIERIEREGEIERFSSALAADAILPEDFAR